MNRTYLKVAIVFLLMFGLGAWTFTTTNASQRAKSTNYAQAEHSQHVDSRSAPRGHDVRVKPSQRSEHGTASPAAHSSSSDKSSRNVHGVAAATGQSISLIDPAKLAKLDHERHREINVKEVHLADVSDGVKLFMVLGLAPVVVSLLVGVLWKFGMFSHLRVAGKLYSGFGAMIALTFLLGLVGIYSLSPTGKKGDLQATFLNLDLMVEQVSALQYEFLLIGIQDKAHGERILKNHDEVVKEFHVQLDKIQAMDLDEAEEKVCREISKYAEKYDTSFDDMAENYHEIEKFKEHLDVLGEQVDYQLGALLNEHRRDLQKLQSSRASSAAISRQIELVEVVAECELLALRLSHAEVEFLLDKHVDRVKVMEQELTQLTAYLKTIRALIPEAAKDKPAKDKHEETEDLALLAEVERGLREYRIELSKVVEDEFIVKVDLVDCSEDLLEIEHRTTALSIRAANARHAEQALAIKMVWGMIAMAAVLGSVLAWLTSRGITNRINELAKTLKDIAQGEGDLTQRLPVTSNDELADVARWFNTFIENLQDIFQQIAGSASTLSGTSTELSATSTQMATGATNTSAQAATVAAATEEMTTNMGNMAASTEEMTTNIQTVASAVEEITTSISEIAKTSEQASNIAKRATELTESSNTTIGQLGTAADEIGKVIEVIQDIAEQTNLLALNATIEAARAGDAGKGFAVVATEVKELARQTAEATEDIRKRIEGIQGSTHDAVRSIGEVGEAIKEVNNTSSTIASAVEEQSITTKEIASNVSQTAQAASSVSTGVFDSACACQEINRNILSVDEAAKQTAQGAAQTQSAGLEMSKLSEELQTLVGAFKL